MFSLFGEIKISQGKQINYLQLTPITCCRCMFVGFFFKKITPLAILGPSSESKKWKQLNYTDWFWGRLVMHLWEMFNGCYFSKKTFSLSGCQCDMQIYVSIVSSIDGFNSSHANTKIKIFNRFCLNSEQRFVFMCNRVCSWFSPGLIGTFHACYQSMDKAWKSQIISRLTQQSVRLNHLQIFVAWLWF